MEIWGHDLIHRYQSRVHRSLLLVEQNAHRSLRIAHRGYVLDTGRIVLSGRAEQLARDPHVKAAYLGG